MAKKQPGKYDGHLHKLTRIVSTEPPAYQERVELRKSELREEFNGQPPAAMANRYRTTRAEIDELEAQVSKKNLELEAVSQLLVESQEQGAEGWGQYGASETTLRLIDGDSLRVQPEPYTATEDRDVLRAHFLNHADLIRHLAPPWATINALNKERLLNGETELPGTKLYVKTKIVYTANKPTKRKDDLAGDL